MTDISNTTYIVPKIISLDDNTNLIDTIKKVIYDYNPNLELNYNEKSNSYIIGTNYYNLNIYNDKTIVKICDYNDYHKFESLNNPYSYLNGLINNIKNSKFDTLIIIWVLEYSNEYFPIKILEYKFNHNDDLIKTSENIYPKKNNHKIDHLWISASKTRNFLMDDPILDYLEYNKINEPEDLNIDNNIRKRKYNQHSSPVLEPKNNDNFLSTILSNGIIFEDDIIKKLLDKYSNDIVTIMDIKSFDQYVQINIKDPVFFEMTFEMMKKGVPIIYQAVLHDPDNRTYGLPDLLIRGDYINKIFNAEIDIWTLKIDSINQYPYYVVDIKNSNIHLAAGSDMILNYNGCKPYKGQIAIYHRIISKLQQFDTGRGFILASKWSRKLGSSNYQCSNPFERLGIIDFAEKDSHYLLQINEATSWLRLIKDPNNNLNCLEPNNPNLYPNMSSNSDGKYRKVKKFLANKNHEITSIWMCGPKQRNNALKAGISKWSNGKLNSKILGINGKNAKIIDLMLKINRKKSKKIDEIIYPKKITSNYNNWRNRKKMAFYIDFETINTATFEGNKIFEDIQINNPNCNDLIFMIGIGYSINSKWDYKCLIADDLTDDSQMKLINQMIKYIKKIHSEHNYKNDKLENINIYHWSNFEPNILNKLSDKYKIKIPKYNWTDLLKIFHDEPIIIKGAFNFSLKTIGKALYDLNLIKTIWDDNIDIKNGLDAMYHAYQIYSENCDNSNIKNNKEMLDIKNYNYIDCKIMWDILNALAKHF